jgi:hypothetical protein
MQLTIFFTIILSSALAMPGSNNKGDAQNEDIALQVVIRMIQRFSRRLGYF